MLVVSYADISSEKDYQPLIKKIHKKRLEYINSISCVERKKQSVYSWWLLGKALESINLDITSFDFDVDSNGRWFEKTSSFVFSISHSKNIVCVALSINSPVAIDVEECGNKILGVSSLFPEINPKKSTVENIRDLTKKWTERECRIKEPLLNSLESFYVNDNKLNNYCITIGYIGENSCNGIVKVNID